VLTDDPKQAVAPEVTVVFQGGGRIGAITRTDYVFRVDPDLASYTPRQLQIGTPLKLSADELDWLHRRILEIKAKELGK
jgi:hypothetical protein